MTVRSAVVGPLRSLGIYLGSLRTRPPSLANRAYFGDVAGVKRLLASGTVKPTDRDGGGATAMHAAAFPRNENGPLIMDLLIQNGWDINVQGNNGKTPLADAASPNNDNPFAVRALLQRGANPDLADNRGLTPFDVGSPRVKKIILDFKLRAAGKALAGAVDSWQSPA